MQQEEEQELIFSTDDENEEKKNNGGATGADNKGLGLRTTGFKDFFLRPELLRAIGEAGFEHPSEVQQEAIPFSILGNDLVCQAKSGMGKTAVFVLSILHQIDFEGDKPQCLVLCHTRELAFQITKEFERLGKYFLAMKTETLYGGVSVQAQRERLSQDPPHVVVGTPGRVLDLAKSGHLKLDKLKYFVLDECDKMLEQPDMREDVQDIFVKTKHNKQVCMFSATMTEESRNICKKFMRSPLEIFIDDQKKLTLHGLVQYYSNLQEKDKTKTLLSLLYKLNYNQTIIFCKSIERAKFLNEILCKMDLPSIAIHRKMTQEDRIEKYKEFKEFKKRILVATNILARGIDIERVNVVFNYDMPDDSDTYLHRVGRAGRFGTKGLAITFVSTEEETKTLNDIQARFAIEIKTLPDSIDQTVYRNN